jgi:hypothetical protein
MANSSTSGAALDAERITRTLSTPAETKAAIDACWLIIGPDGIRVRPGVTPDQIRLSAVTLMDLAVAMTRGRKLDG